MAINNKPAEVYAKPHTMSGNDINVKDAVVKPGKEIDELRPSIGNIFKSQPETKTTGLETRGNGAATKGRIARGPMA
jgi:hypothetical protein